MVALQFLSLSQLIGLRLEIKKIYHRKNGLHQRMTAAQVPYKKLAPTMIF